MSASPPSAVKTPYTAILDAVSSSEELAIAREKARIEKLKNLAIGVIRAVYKDWAPEDLPVDVFRLEKDIKTHMDILRDRTVEDTQKKFRMASCVLREVAEKAPQFYFDAGEPEGIKERRWKRDLPKEVEPAPAPVVNVKSLLPPKVIQQISAHDQRTILRMLADAKDGVRFFDIEKVLGYTKNREKLQALRAYMNFLRAGGHVDVEGKTKGLRYRALGSLATIVEI